MPFEKWTTFFLVMTVIAYTPGPMTMFSMSSSVRNGFMRTIPAIIGGSCAYAVQMAIVYYGLLVLVQNSLAVFNIIKWVGVFYIVFLALNNWQKAESSLTAGGDSPSASPSRQFGLGMATGLSNPKSILVLIVLFPQFTLYCCL